MSDAFDDFEMRPITEGLGFHKKALKTKKEVKKSDLAQEILGSHQTPSAPPMGMLDLDAPTSSRATKPRSTEPVISDTLPREDWPGIKGELKMDFMESTEVVRSEPEISIDQIFPKQEIRKPRSNQSEKPSMITPESFLESSLLESALRRGAADSPSTKRLVESPIALPALIVDGLLVVALTMIFLVCLLLVTKANLDFIAAHLNSQVTLQLSLFAMISSIGLSYFCISRILCGQSLGEWAFEYQVGSDDEQRQTNYPIKVLARSLVTLVTGVILLPIASAVLRKDVISLLTGVKLYQRQG